jgi:hypothetical protein
VQKESATATVTFSPRYAIPEATDPDPIWLRDLILRPSEPGREFGEATITFRDGDREASLILIVDRTLGYYLILGKHEWLSLGDRGRLTEVVCPDDWEASAGLFVPAEKAWAAISEFCASGMRSDAIEWIRPSEVPAGGNH